MKKIWKAGILIWVAFAWACNSEYPGFRKTDGDLYYKFHVKNNSGVAPLPGDILTVLMTYRTPDSIIFSSSDIPEPFRFPLDEPAFKGDIFEGLAMMHVGDSATFIVSADSLKLYGDLPMNFREAVVYFDVKLLSVQRKAEFEKEKERMQATDRKALEKMQAVEDAAIAQYISDNNIRIKPSSSGLYFRWIKKGRGGFAVSGQVVEIHYIARFLDGEKIFASRDQAGESIFFELGSGFEIAAVEEALILMNPGSHASLIVPSKLAYGNSGIRGAVPPYSPLLFDLELIAVHDKQAYKSKMEQLEIRKISEYLKENKLNVRADASGLYYIEEVKGKGAKAAPGKTVRVHFTGKFLDGRIFDSSHKYDAPVEFKLGAGEAIEGWDAGIAYMAEGGQARLLLPSRLAFGDSYNGSIPPFSPLLYEIELLSVR